MLNFARFPKFLAACAFLAAGFLATPALFSTPALASDQTELLAHANHTVDDLKTDPAFAEAARMMHNARAVLIVPGLVKGGFIFGAEGGNGVLLKRDGRNWSAPAFYTLGSASFGLQIGLEKAELVFLIMSDKALRGIEQSQFKIGAGGGITVVNLSSGAEGATSSHGGDIVVWSSGTGAYGGLTFNGSIIKARNDWNRDFYGHRSSVTGILGSSGTDPRTRSLQSNLASVW